jgi:hypothetical protein
MAVEGVLRARPELAAPEFWPPPLVPQLAVRITLITVRTKNHRLVICANSLDSVTVRCLNRYQPPKSQQRAEKPLLIEFTPRARESRIASSSLPRPPGVFCGLAIRWQYILAVVDRSEPILNSIMVPARGLEPRTLGLKDRCSNQAELRRRIQIVPARPSSLPDVLPKCCPQSHPRLISWRRGLAE